MFHSDWRWFLPLNYDKFSWYDKAPLSGRKMKITWRVDTRGARGIASHTDNLLAGRCVERFYLTSVVTRDVARSKIKVGIQCNLSSFVRCRIAPPRLLHALKLIACDSALVFPVSQTVPNNSYYDTGRSRRLYFSTIEFHRLLEPVINPRSKLRLFSWFTTEFYFLIDRIGQLARRLWKNIALIKITVGLSSSVVATKFWRSSFLVSYLRWNVTGM